MSSNGSASTSTCALCKQHLHQSEIASEKFTPEYLLCKDCLNKSSVGEDPSILNLSSKTYLSSLEEMKRKNNDLEQPKMDFLTLNNLKQETACIEENVLSWPPLTDPGNMKAFAMSPNKSDQLFPKTEPENNAENTTTTSSMEKRYKCAFCPQMFSQSGDLKNHILFIHTAVKPYQCMTCGKGFRTSVKLSKHTQVHTSAKKFACTFCEKKFTQQSNLRKHILVHTGEKPFECETCKKRFNCKYSLKSHSLTHTGEKRYHCHICEREFSHNYDLKTHIRTHTLERPYVCTTCGLCCLTASSLKRHIATHTGERTHACTFCDKRFVQKSDLEMHARTHTGYKEFKCAECGREFIKKSDLKTHMFIHSTVKPFNCDMCTKGFATKSKLKRHILVHLKNKLKEEKRKLKKVK